MTKMLMTLLLIVTGGLFAADIYVSPAGGGTGNGLGDETDAESGVAMANPGDTVWFRGGTYPFNLNIKIENGYVNNGTSVSPIECRPYNSESVLFNGNGSFNCFEFTNRSYWIIRDFEFTGYSNGIKFNSASYILVDNCYVHNTASVGINLKGSTNHVTIKNCEVAFPGGTGECFYIGSSSSYAANTCYQNVVKNCHIHDTLSASQGDGIEMKPLCWGNIIRDNVLYNLKYPAIYSWGNSSASEPNVIEGNVVWNTYDVGIEAGNETIIRNNIVFNNRWPGINLRSHPETGSSRINNVLVLNNTLFNNNTNNSGYRGELHIADGLELRNCIIANNVFYVNSATDYAISVFPLDNEPHNTTQFITNHYYKPSNSLICFADMSGPNDEMTFAEWQVYLAGVNVTEGDDASTTGDPGFGNATTSVPGADFYLSSNITGTYFADAAYDIDGVVRSNPPTVGAYEWEAAGSADWSIGTGFKTSITNPNAAGWDPDAAGTQSPLLSIGATPTSGAPPLDVAFTASASDPDGGSIVSYTWDFKDGAPTSAIQNPNHTFNTAGTYNVTCTVFDDEAESRTKTVTISVGAASGGGSSSSGGCGPVSGLSLVLAAAVLMLIRRR